MLLWFATCCNGYQVWQIFWNLQGSSKFFANNFWLLSLAYASFFPPTITCHAWSTSILDFYIISLLIQKSPLQLSSPYYRWASWHQHFSFYPVTLLPLHSASQTELIQPEDYTHSCFRGQSQESALQGRFRCDFRGWIFVALICSESSKCRFKCKYFDLAVKLVVMWYMSLCRKWSGGVSNRCTLEHKINEHNIVRICETVCIMQW